MKILKEISTFVLLIIATLGLVLLSFSASIGVKETVSAFVLGINNLDDLVVSSESERTEQRSILIGGADEDYSDLNLTGYSVQPMNLVVEESPPLYVPTSGIAAHQNFLYNPVIHPGVDIWSRPDGKGIINDAKGNKVISACGGIVGRVFVPNQEIEIYCDKLSEEFKDKVPTLEIKVLYSHLGDALTKEPFHNLKVGQRVEKGEFIGYQGAVSSFAPQNRIVHLHFGVYDVKTREPLNPSAYIGVSSTSLGQVFEIGVEP